MNDDQEQIQPEEFNLDGLQLTNKIATAHQEGNWLIATTEHGVTFRQRLPANKILNKKGDNWILQDRGVA